MAEHAKGQPNGHPSSDPMYPFMEPHANGLLDVGNGHSLYWEECGNAEGPAVVFLHGGPGAGCAAAHRRFFDPDYWRIVLFDQRGCGRSRPTADVNANTTQYIVNDIEAIRIERNIDTWMLFGGSWGSILALVYGIAHPSRCTGFVVRGVFLGAAEELRWFMEDMHRFFPDAGRAFLNTLPPEERDDPLTNYHRRLMDPEPDVHRVAAQAWCNYESACVRLTPSNSTDAGASLPLARIEAHYFINNMFLPEGHVLDNICLINHLPCVIVQGRYDVICPPWTAQMLADAWPGVDLVIVDDAGHSAFEPGIKAALVQATDQMKQHAG
jgi:proline iminopeptidase